MMQKRVLAVSGGKKIMQAEVLFQDQFVIIVPVLVLEPFSSTITVLVLVLVQ